MTKLSARLESILDAPLDLTSGERSAIQEAIKLANGSQDLETLRARCLEAAQTIDQKLPRGIKRIGPIKVEVSFEDEETMWVARVPYKASKRRLSSETTGQHAPTALEAVDQLLEMVSFMADNQDKHHLF